MGMFDVEYSFDELLRTTAAGLEISTFVQMKDAITKRYKEVYGNDIDVDSTTADGQFIMMLSLMLFNGYSGLYYLSQNLDPACATNTFLDRLCSFNNVFRRTAEPSYAYLYVKYIGQIENYNSITDNTEVQEITCMDSTGKLWKWEEGKGLSNFPTTFVKGKVYSLKFVCQELGAIEALADNEHIKNLTVDEIVSSEYRGEISQVIDKSVYPFEVWQAKDATVGTDDETDTALRQRRLLEIGNNGVTVLNGLRGSLIEIEGVEESKIYTNVITSTENSFNTKDGSDVEYHDVYICIRYKKGIEVDNTLIGQTIYNKMTPGIVTAPLNRGYGNVTSTTGSTYKAYLPYEQPSSSEETETNWNEFGVSRKYEVNIYQGVLRDTIYWKQCKGIYPAMQLRFLFNKNLYQKGHVENSNWEYSEIEKTIVEAIKKYTYNLTIFDDLNIPNLMGNVNSASPISSGQTTYIFIDGRVRKKIEVSVSEQSETEGKYTFSDEKITDTDYTSSDAGTYFENCDTYYDYSDSTFKFEYSSDPENNDYIQAKLHVYITEPNE